MSLLLIEDSEPELELMAYLLQAGGYFIVSARNGEVGLALLGRERVDLVVCDVFLPGMNGYALARQLKSDPAFRRIPLLAVTSLNQIGVQEKLQAAGFDGYIGKPIDAPNFVRQVESFLALAKDGIRLPDHAIPRPAPAGRCILVVDDLPTDAERLRAGLEPCGCQITLASSPARAMELLAGGHFDAIVSDLHLPEYDGFGFLSSVKANPEQQGIPFLFLSSSVWRAEDRPVALNLPRTRFLRRPVAPRYVLQEVETCLVAGGEG